MAYLVDLETKCPACGKGRAVGDVFNRSDGSTTRSPSSARTSQVDPDAWHSTPVEAPDLRVRAKRRYQQCEGTGQKAGPF